jgi:hypothetical protein
MARPQTIQAPIRVPDLGTAVKGATAIVLAAVAALLLPGCLEPFRVRVDEEVLTRAPGWAVTQGAVDGGFLGPKTREMRYAFDRDADAPTPFAGSLQVFGIRGLSSLDRRELLDLAKDLVEHGAADKNITLDPGGAAGKRETVSGVGTSWFVREGRTTQTGDLFQQGVRVRILGEVGHDGRSDTSFLVIGMAQVSRTNQCPIIGPCQPEETNLQTWIQIVGDPEGSIQGATSSSGFVDHLVTR